MSYFKFKNSNIILKQWSTITWMSSRFDGGKDLSIWCLKIPDLISISIVNKWSYTLCSSVNTTSPGITTWICCSTSAEFFNEYYSNEILSMETYTQCAAPMIHLLAINEPPQIWLPLERMEHYEDSTDSMNSKQKINTYRPWPIAW